MVSMYLTYYVTQRNTNYFFEREFLLLDERIRKLNAKGQHNVILKCDDKRNTQVKTFRVKSSNEIENENIMSNIKIARLQQDDIGNRENEKMGSYERCRKEVLSKQFKDIKLSEINHEEVEYKIKQHCLNGETKQCPSPVFVGALKVRTHIVTDQLIYNSELQFVRYGGWWSPANCNEKQMVAIVIPFRAREEHLAVLLRHLHPILKRQQLHYRIFVVEQDKKYKFNKGKLINAGFLEIQRLFPYSCFVFQDVDLVPEDDRIDYACKQSPMHLAGLIDKFNYTLHSQNAFGGVVSFSTNDYKKVNGFSNLFWVWGGEDDNLYRRVVLNGLISHRECLQIARYTMLKHTNRMYTRTANDHYEGKKSMRMAIQHANADGLNSVSYHLTEVRRKKLYTLIKINLFKSNGKNSSSGGTKIDMLKSINVVQFVLVLYCCNI
jgi:hypothetical protein